MPSRLYCSYTKKEKCMCDSTITVDLFYCLLQIVGLSVSKSVYIILTDTSRSKSKWHGGSPFTKVLLYIHLWISY